MYAFKKDYAGPTLMMYYKPWGSKDTMIRVNRIMPHPITIDHNDISKPQELHSSLNDVTAIHRFWDKYYETSEYKMNNSISDIQKMFKNNGMCLSLKDHDKNIYATMFSYESDGPIYINGKMKSVRIIDGVCINHKSKDEIAHWLFSWMEYLVPSIYIYTSDNLPTKICSSYSNYKYYATSANFILDSQVGDVDKIPKSEFNKYQDIFIKKYHSEFNIIYGLNSDNLDIELYKVPIQFHSNSYYIVGVVNTHKTYKKNNLHVYEVVFCISMAADNHTIVNPTEDEQYLTRYVIESVCKAGNYPMLLVSTKYASGDICEYNSQVWRKFKLNKKKLYIYNYLTTRFYNASIYYPK